MFFSLTGFLNQIQSSNNLNNKKKERERENDIYQSILLCVCCCFTSHPRRLVAKIPADIIAENSIPNAPRMEMVVVSPASFSFALRIKCEVIVYIVQKEKKKSNYKMIMYNKTPRRVLFCF